MLIGTDIKDIRHVDNKIVKIMGDNRVLWEFPQDDKIGAPGNRTLLAGIMDAGWFGEVPASDFITGDELAKVVGLTTGVSQHSNEPWLKFAYKGEVHLVAKKPLRHSINWFAINSVNCVYGDRVIEIKGKKYAVMLMRGIGEDVQPDPRVMISEFKGRVDHNSMWNKLMLPIHKNAPSSWAHPDNVKSPTENWNVGYTDSDLLTHYNYGNGTYAWCQEKVVSEKSYIVIRGHIGVSYSTNRFFDNSTVLHGWRPVLKLVG